MALITLKQLLDHAAENSFGLPVCLQPIIAEKNAFFAKQVKIIYGGSLNSDNSKALLSRENIDGGLIGLCSIDPQSSIKLCHVTDELNYGEVL